MLKKSEHLWVYAHVVSDIFSRTDPIVNIFFCYIQQITDVFEITVDMICDLSGVSVTR